MRRSKRQIKTLVNLEKGAALLPTSEASRFKADELELVDETIVIKTFVGDGEVAGIVSASKNTILRRGINDFKDGEIKRVDDGGSITVDSVRISYAAGVMDDDAASKSFKTVGVPADIENSVLRIEQGGRLVRELKIASHILKGDAPQKLGEDFIELDVPLILAAGSPVKIDLMRPEGSTGTACFIGIEFNGMKTFPKRSK